VNIVQKTGSRVILIHYSCCMFMNTGLCENSVYPYNYGFHPGVLAKDYHYTNMQKLYMQKYCAEIDKKIT